MSNSRKSDFVLPLIYGVIAHVTLHYGVQAYTHFAATRANMGPTPAWYSLSYPLLWAIAATAPGFLAGWFATNRTFLIGAAVGFFASCIEQPMIDMDWSSHLISAQTALVIAAYALSPAVVSAVACAAGRLARPAPPAQAPVAPVAAKPRRR